MSDNANKSQGVTKSGTTSGVKYSLFPKAPQERILEPGDKKKAMEDLQDHYATSSGSKDKKEPKGDKDNCVVQ
jgi:hypothetical protein